MKKWSYFLFNGLFIACLYLGFVNHIEGAKDVALFMAWVIAGIGMIGWFVLDTAPAEFVSEGKSFSVPHALDVMLDMIALIFIVWFGHYVLGIFYLISIIFRMTFREAVEKIEKERV